MSKVNALLTQRLKKTETTSKMAVMAQQSTNGNLTSFSGIFSVADLSEHEKERIALILKEYAFDDNIQEDLDKLVFITSEVKAINNQAALLHGERIKKAHGILTRYRDGAFTAWMMAAYGNRQTPYNLMQYYEFCEAMPKTLRFQIESMPRQAIYTLASREGPLEKKRSIVESYKGETKLELLALIRQTFPLGNEDGRRQNPLESVLQTLSKAYKELQRNQNNITKNHKTALNILLKEIQSLIDNA